MRIDLRAQRSQFRVACQHARLHHLHFDGTGRVLCHRDVMKCHRKHIQQASCEKNDPQIWRKLLIESMQLRNVRQSSRKCARNQRPQKAQHQRIREMRHGDSPHLRLAKRGKPAHISGSDRNEQRKHRQRNTYQNTGCPWQVAERRQKYAENQRDRHPGVLIDASQVRFSTIRGIHHRSLSCGSPLLQISPCPSRSESSSACPGRPAPCSESNPCSHQKFPGPAPRHTMFPERVSRCRQKLHSRTGQLRFPRGPHRADRFQFRQTMIAVALRETLWRSGAFARRRKWRSHSASCGDQRCFHSSRQSFFEPAARSTSQRRLPQSKPSATLRPTKNVRIPTGSVAAESRRPAGLHPTRVYWEPIVLQVLLKSVGGARTARSAPLSRTPNCSAKRSRRSLGSLLPESIRCNDRDLSFCRARAT